MKPEFEREDEGAWSTKKPLKKNYPTYFRKKKTTPIFVVVEEKCSTFVLVICLWVLLVKEKKKGIMNEGVWICGGFGWKQRLDWRVGMVVDAGEKPQEERIVRSKREVRVRFAERQQGEHAKETQAGCYR